MEIGLPDEKGRQQILTIHTNKMRDNSFLDRNVDLAALGKPAASVGLDPASKRKLFAGHAICAAKPCCVLHGRSAQPPD